MGSETLHDNHFGLVVATYNADGDDPDSADPIYNKCVDEVQEGSPAVVEPVDHERLPTRDSQGAQLDHLRRCQ